MVAIPKVVGVMSSGFLLCLGLSGNAASTADEMKEGQSGERIGGQEKLKGEPHDQGQSVESRRQELFPQAAGL
jgi:hypothetical protein